MVPIAILAALVLQQQAPPPAPAAGAPPTAAAVSDPGAHRHADGREPPVITAVHVSTGALRMDGRLDDAVWAQAEPVSGFTQRYPQDGEPASARTEVRLAYDEEALYVAARMYDAAPSGVAANGDHFEFAIDPEHDHRTAYFFKVSPLGQTSTALIGDDGASQEPAWNPAWDAVVRRDSLGWTVECRIPYSQLRVTDAATQVWGINFNRHFGRTEEDVFWARIGQADNGYSSFFGHVLGIANLPPMPRLKTPPPR